MITIAKLIILFMLSLFGKVSNDGDLASNYLTIESVTTIVNDSTQTKAFSILTEKCNSCHVKRNRRRVFTETNMNAWSHDVYQQVFVKKRMPRGNKIKLTNEEYQDLLTWISSTKQYNNGNQL